MADQRHERRPQNTIQEIGQRTAEAGEHAARTGGEVAQQGADALQQILQTGLDLTRQMSGRSAEHVAMMFGLSGNGTQHAAQQSSRNVEAIISSGTVVAQTLQEMSREWFDFSRRRMEQNFEKMNALMRCRTPQDLVAAQSDLLRDNVESLMQNNRKLAELSLRMAEESGRKMTERMRSAA